MTQESIEEDGCELELSDEDILDAMQHIPGYLDISTEDFRIIYHLAWQHALARLQARKDRG
jgi:CBS-domain-containing membrane protein